VLSFRNLPGLAIIASQACQPLPRCIETRDDFVVSVHFNADILSNFAIHTVPNFANTAGWPFIASLIVARTTSSIQVRFSLSRGFIFSISSFSNEVNIHLCAGARGDCRSDRLFNPFGKTKAAKRKIPLTTAALAIIKRRTDEAKGEYLFAHRSDKDKPMLKVNNAHTTALKNSKVKTFSFTTSGTPGRRAPLRVEWTCRRLPLYSAIRN
jgi:hypothetical protein